MFPSHAEGRSWQNLRFFSSRRSPADSFPSPIASLSRHRLPSLDGLRTLSLLLVLCSHLIGTQGFLLSTVPHVLDELGNFGVRIFFVISGYLITTLLLREQERTGTISLAGFYIRRAFRILPAFYLFFATVVALQFTGLLHLDAKHLIAAGTHTINYDAGRPWIVAHLWSLAVEEQFYFVWPLTLCALGAMRGMRAAAIVAVICPLVRFASWQFHWQEELVGSSFPTIADALATGCLLAGWQERLARVRWYARFLQSWWIWSVPVVLFAVLQLGSRPRISGLVGQSLEHLGIAIILDRCVRFPHGRTGTFLNTKPMVLFGGWTYSIYLWQQLFLDRFSGHVWNAFPLNLGLAVLVGAASFYFVERPVLAWRERLMAATKKASNSLAAAPPATAAGATHLAAAAAAAGGRQSTR